MTLVNVPKSIAFFETTLAAAISSTATSFTLTSATDADGTVLADDTYAFVIDEGSSNEEIVVCRCIGTAVTESLRGVSVRTGNTEVTALKKSHRRGASVKMTTGPAVPIVTNIMRGDGALDFQPVNDGDICTKKYVDDIAIAGAADASTGTKGITKMSVAPASATSPIAVGDNDPRIPTSDESDALAGTGTPNSTNKFVTNDDTSTTHEVSKVTRLTSGGAGSSYKLDASGSTTEIADSTGTETDIFSVTIPADMLGTANAIRFKVFVSNFTTATVSAGVATFRLKYGSTTLVSVANAQANVSSQLLGTIEGILSANASDAAQTGFMSIDFSENQNNPSLDFGSATSIDFLKLRGVGTATEDSTGALDLSLTIQWYSGNASNDFVPAGYTVELIS